jgi:cytoskeletal protein CcmA (bactofilin family)
LIALSARSGTNTACKFSLITNQENHMLQKDSFFRRQDPPPARGLMPPTPAPTPQAPPAAPPAAHDAAKTAHRPEDRKEAKLVVGPDIRMKGVEISDCDTLQVEGRIEATLDARVLHISEKGVFSGTVAVDSAEIHGTVEGEITVRKQLVVHATGRLSGKIRYARIKVEEGAELSGEISVLEKSPAIAAPKRPALN